VISQKHFRNVSETIKACTGLITLTLDHTPKSIIGVKNFLFPGLHTQLLSLAVRKVERRPGRIYMMRAAADVT